MRPNRPYEIDYVMISFGVGHIDEAKAQLVQAALDHGAARMSFNDRPFLVRREWLLDAVKVQSSQSEL